MSTKFIYATIKNRLLISIIFATLIIVAFYGFFIEPNKVRLKTVKIHNKAMASAFKGLKIIQLSDLHIGGYISSSTKCTLKIFK